MKNNYKKIKMISLFLAIIMTYTLSINVVFALNDEEIKKSILSSKEDLKSIKDANTVKDDNNNEEDNNSIKEKSKETELKVEESTNIDSKTLDLEIESLDVGNFSEGIEDEVQNTSDIEETVEVNNEEELIEAIKNQNIKNIIISEDISLEETIIIDRGIKIQGSTGKVNNIKLTIQTGKHIHINPGVREKESESSVETIDVIIENIDFISEKPDFSLASSEYKGNTNISGGIISENTNLKIYNTSFKNNYAKSDSILYTDGKNTLLENVIFENNYVETGELIFSKSLNTILKNTNFVNNIANKSGILYCLEGTLFLDGCNFYKNENYLGVIIYSNSEGTFINDSVFKDNISYTLVVAEDYLTITNSTFISNDLSTIQLENLKANIKILNTTFENTKLLIEDTTETDSYIDILNSKFLYTASDDFYSDFSFIEIHNFNNSRIGGLNLDIDNTMFKNDSIDKEISILDIVGNRSYINIDCFNIESINNKNLINIKNLTNNKNYLGDKRPNININISESGITSDRDINIINGGVRLDINLKLDKNFISSKENVLIINDDYFYSYDVIMNLYLYNNTLLGDTIDLSNTYYSISEDYFGEDGLTRESNEQNLAFKDLNMIHNTVRISSNSNILEKLFEENSSISNNIIIIDNISDDNKTNDNELSEDIKPYNLIIKGSVMGEYLEKELKSINGIRKYYKPISELIQMDYRVFYSKDLYKDMLGKLRKQNIDEKITYGAVEYTKEENQSIRKDDCKETSKDSSSSYSTSDYNTNTNLNNEIKVTFNANGGLINNKESKIINIKKGQIYNKSIIPERKGYRFLGWSKQKNHEEFFNFTKPINQDIKVYALWEKDKGRLDKINHFSYIKGYSDISVRPEENITREEVAAIFYRLLTDEYKQSIYSLENNFTDLSSKRWSNKYISTLANGNILTGYEDGEFKYESFITRAEVATIISRLENLDGSNHNFTDVKGHWAEEYIASASKKGWVEGYKDGYFRPDDYITRAEFVTLVNRVLNRGVKKENILEGIKEFKDLKDNTWYYEEFVEAINGHTFDRYDENDRASEKWLELKDFNKDM